MTRHVFVYGTLRPGDVRWHFLEPFVVDGGMADSVPGQLFDTGFDYPAAVFDGGGTIIGHTFALLEASARAGDRRARRGGGRRRRRVLTASACEPDRGLDAWAYAYGSGLDLTPIPSGDWLQHRPLP